MDCEEPQNQLYPFTGNQVIPVESSNVYPERFYINWYMGLDKTVMAVGSDTLKGAREVYAAVKQHKDKVPGLSAVYDEMSAFFKKNKIKTTSAPSEG